jgi:hypothetical protein
MYEEYIARNFHLFDLVTPDNQLGDAFQSDLIAASSYNPLVHGLLHELEQYGRFPPVFVLFRCFIRLHICCLPSRWFRIRYYWRLWGWSGRRLRGSCRLLGLYLGEATFYACFAGLKVFLLRGSALHETNSECTHWVLPSEGLVYRSVAPSNPLCSYQKAHHEEDVVLVEYLGRNYGIAAWESLVLCVLLLVSTSTYPPLILISCSNMQTSHECSPLGI